MWFLRHLFRVQPDGYVFQNFNIRHMLILVVAVFGCYLIFLFKDEIKRNKVVNSFVKNMIVIVLLLQQIILYTWYVVSDYKILTQGLPLYNCRIAILAIVVGLIINNKLLKTLACYWGGFGVVFALAMPGIDPFSFPHYTVISYFVGHLFLAWGIMYIFIVEGFKYNKENLKSILIFTNVYHVIIFCLNKVIGANYCYLNESPIAFGKDFSQIGYTLLVMMVFNVAICLSYILVTRLSERFADNDEDEEDMLTNLG